MALGDGVQESDLVKKFGKSLPMPMGISQQNPMAVGGFGGVDMSPGVKGQQTQPGGVDMPSKAASGLLGKRKDYGGDQINAF